MITLKSLPKATKQEVFDQVAKHLLSQRTASKDPFGNTCQYRFDGLKCAAGCLIGDDEYDEGMEHIDWVCLAEQNRVPNAHSEFIAALQTIHDNEAPLYWPDHLVQLGENHHLDTTSVTRFYCWDRKAKSCDCPACGGFND